MNKIVVCIMGQNCEKFIGMCLESVKESDAIVYCSGGTIEQVALENPHIRRWTIHRDTGAQWIIQNDLEFTLDDRELGLRSDTEFKKRIIVNPYNQEDKGMNGKQRNFYLSYLKENYPYYWALVLDADEVVDDFNKIRRFVQTEKEGLYSVHMRHFHNDLGHEDATVEKHYVLNRLFKVSEALGYDEVEHPVLKPHEDCFIGSTDCTAIWHLAHINHCFNIKNRYEKNMKHSNIHNPEFLNWWLKAHLFGQYPSKQINLTEIPSIILKNFHINPDEIYFANRGIEMKHFQMVKQWIKWLRNEYSMADDYAIHVIEFGCGRAPYGFVFNYLDEVYEGVEISEYAVKNAFIPIKQGDITDYPVKENYYDLVLCIDVLEHLTDEQLSKALNNIKDCGDRYIFSIPFIGDPNLTNDKTHKQFMSREDWKVKIESYGIKIEPTPSDWLFAHQILVGKKACST